MDSAVEKAVASPHQPETAAEVDARWRRYCVAEVMARNPQVNEFVGDKERHIEHLESQLERMREALEFYADFRRYDGPNQRYTGGDPYTPEDASYLTDVTRDRGSFARAALTKEEKDG